MEFSRILEWVAFSFSRRSSRPRDQTQVSCIAGGLFTSWTTREAQQLLLSVLIRYRLSNPFLWEDREESKQPKLVCTSKQLVHICLFIQQIITGTYHGGDPVSILGQFSWEDPLEKGMATHSRILACRISWTEKPCRLQSMGSQMVRHDWATNTFTSILLWAKYHFSCLKHISVQNRALSGAYIVLEGDKQ